MGLLRLGELETVWLNLDYSPLFDDNGRLIGVIAFVVEPTHALQARTRLKTSEAHAPNRTVAQCLYSRR